MRLPRVPKSTPASAYSSRIQPTETPHTTRPGAIAAALETALAGVNGSRSAARYMLVASLSRLVTAPIAESATHGSSHGMSSGHQILPSSVYGYLLSMRVDITR